MQPRAVLLPVLALALLLAAAGCTAPDTTPAIPVNADLSTLALAPADLPFTVLHRENQSQVASPGSLIQDNRDILKVFRADYIDQPAITPSMTYLKQDIVLFAPGTVGTNYDSTLASYRTLQDPAYSVQILDSPGVGDRSFAFALRYDKGTETANPVMGVVFTKSDILELLQVRAPDASAATIAAIAKTAAAKIGAEIPLETPTSRETIPPEILDSSDNSPAGVVRQYYTAMDTGNYTAATDILLPDLRPGADWATAKRKSVAFDKVLYGTNGEKLQYANLSLDAWQQVGDCDIHLPDMKKICQDNHFDLVFSLRISYDEMDILDSGPVWNHHNDSVYAARYKGTWYLIL